MFDKSRVLHISSLSFGHPHFSSLRFSYVYLFKEDGCVLGCSAVQAVAQMMEISETSANSPP
jgi:hypothetical protein